MVQVPEEIISAARAAEAKWNFPASVTLAQWALESGWGQHMPPESNNPFGIKAVPNDGNDFVLVATQEWVGGRFVRVQAMFRKFPDITTAFLYHAELIATKGYYVPAMQVWEKEHTVETFVPLMAEHYATDPGYAKKVLELIKEYDWTKLDSATLTQAQSEVQPSLFT